MNVSTDNEINRPLEVFESTVMVLIIVIASFGNGLVCLSVYKNRRLRTPTGLLIAALAVADLLTALCVLPLSAAALIGVKNGKAYWVSKQLVGPASFYQGFLMYGLTCVSLCTIALTAVNRYLCVVKPYLYIKYFTKKTVLRLIATMWFVTFGTEGIVVSLGYTEFVFSRTMAFSFFALKKEYVHYSVMVHSLWGFGIVVIPLFIIICCYSKIYWTIRRHYRTVAVANIGYQENQNRGISCRSKIRNRCKVDPIDEIVEFENQESDMGRDVDRNIQEQPNQGTQTITVKDSTEQIVDPDNIIGKNIKSLPHNVNQLQANFSNIKIEDQDQFNSIKKNLSKTCQAQETEKEVDSSYQITKDGGNIEHMSKIYVVKTITSEERTNQSKTCQANETASDVGSSDGANIEHISKINIVKATTNEEINNQSKTCQAKETARDVGSSYHTTKDGANIEHISQIFKATISKERNNQSKTCQAKETARDVEHISQIFKATTSKEINNQSQNKPSTSNITYRLDQIYQSNNDTTSTPTKSPPNEQRMNVHKPTASNLSDAKVTKTLLAVFVGFCFCWIPVMITGIITGNPEFRFRHLHVLVVFFGALSSAINPFIYGALNRDFRKTYVRILRNK